MALKKITGNETPRPLRGKTSKFNRQVRFVDLNESLKEIEENFIQLPANPQNGDALVYNGDKWIADNEYQEVTVLITSEQLKDLDENSPIDFTDVFPVLNINTQYLDTEITVIFNKGTENFNFNNTLAISVGNSSTEVGTNFVNNLVSLPINNIPVKIVGIIKGSPEPIGGKITTTGLVKSPTGDSNITLVIRYRVLEY